MAKRRTKTGKPVDLLTVDDFDESPIWRFATESEGEHDETWVVPLAVTQIPVGAVGLLVAADFACENGGELEGFVSVTVGKALWVPDGTILSRGKFVNVSADIKGSELEYAAEQLRVSEVGFLPMKWTLRAKVAGEHEYRSGEFSP
jgi:hypothetical protein